MELLLGNVVMKSLKLSILVISFLLAWSPEAYAKKSKRVGFNFGTSMRLTESDDRTNAGIGSDKNTHKVQSSQLVVPYIGYSFGNLNLGLVMSSEQNSSTTLEKDEDGVSETSRKMDLSSKSGSLFIRFLFGEVFFFEAGAGIVNQKVNVSEEKKTISANGTFDGEKDEYEVKGVGPGYHAGIGMEFHMTNGFYFTSAYHTRIIQLRDFDGKSNLGAKRSFEQKREVLFGLAHYTK